jgi:acyl-coenzyme A synthetase/AMP-(fatty) acid ligase
MSRISLSEQVERASADERPLFFARQRSYSADERPLLFAEQRSYSAAELCRAAETMPLSHEQRRGAVVLRLRSPLKLALALLALDGVAERILLLSADASVDDTIDLLGRFGASSIVTDQESSAGLPFEPVGWRGEVNVPASGALHRDQRDTLWTLTTSGTTGTPKLVAHRLASLARTTRTTGERLRQLRWGLLYEMTRFAGIQVFLQGVLSGGGLIAPDPKSGLPDQVATLVREKCTALSATPTLWRKLLMTPEAKGLDLRQVTLGGEIADPAVLAILAKEFPNARITHVYASTEAGAAFAVADGKAGFPASYVDEAPNGISLRVVDNRLFVHNDAVTPAYVGGGTRFADPDGFVDTGDVVERVGDRFVFRGRANGVINVGGNKIFPEEVEKQLLAHPRVASARVFGKPSPITGQLVAGEVVIVGDQADSSAIVAELRASCRAALQAWQVPATIKVVDEIATNIGSKMVRVPA